MLEAKDQGHKRECSPKKKKKRSSQKLFRRSPKKKKKKKKEKKKVFTKLFRRSPKEKKKVFTKIFQAISAKKRFPKNFSSASQNFNNSKVLETRTGQFSRTWGLEAKAKGFKICPWGLHLWFAIKFLNQKRFLARLKSASKSLLSWQEKCGVLLLELYLAIGPKNLASENDVTELTQLQMREQKSPLAFSEYFAR